jgi:hypothetical protein
MLNILKLYDPIKILFNDKIFEEGINRLFNVSLDLAAATYTYLTLISYGKEKPAYRLTLCRYAAAINEKILIIIKFFNKRQ